MERLFKSFSRFYLCFSTGSRQKFCFRLGVLFVMMLVGLSCMRIEKSKERYVCRCAVGETIPTCYYENE